MKLILFTFVTLLPLYFSLEKLVTSEFSKDSILVEDLATWTIKGNGKTPAI